MAEGVRLIHVPAGGKAAALNAAIAPPGPHLHGEEIRGHNQFQCRVRNSFQVVFRLRSGAGLIPCRFRISAIVLRASSCPRLNNAPWMRR